MSHHAIAFFSQPPRPLTFPFSHNGKNILAYFGGSRRTFSTGAVIAPRKLYRKPNKFRDGDEAPQEFSALHADLKVLGLCVAKEVPLSIRIHARSIGMCRPNIKSSAHSQSHRRQSQSIRRIKVWESLGVAGQAWFEHGNLPQA